MKRILTIVTIVILAFLVIIQFFPPEKNDKLVNPQNDIAFSVNIPANVKNKIVDACYDCHSDKTKYPFYNRIAPVSWLLARDIRHAKKHVNFSEWAGYSRKQQIKILTSICDELTAGEMPLKSYVFMHSKAVINQDEREAICKWTEQAAEEILNK